MASVTETEPTTVTPEPIIGTVVGVLGAQYLLVANEVGLFEQLGEDALAAEELAERTGLPARSARILADGLVVWGLLEREGAGYRNGPTAAAFLRGGTPIDLRAYVRMAHRILYPRWGELEATMRAGGGDHVEQFHVADEAQRILSEGIESLTAANAARLAEAVDFGAFGRLLDVAGGTGNHLQAVLERHPGLEGTLFELPPVAAQARQRLAPLLDAGRATIVEGDVFEDPLPGGHDVVLVSETLHTFTPEPNRRLLRRIRQAVDVGARLLLVDAWTNAERTEPAPAVLSAAIFYQLTGGDTYPVDEARAWLAETGWRFVDHRPLGGPSSLVEAEAS